MSEVPLYSLPWISTLLCFYFVQGHAPELGWSKDARGISLPAKSLNSCLSHFDLAYRGTSLPVRLSRMFCSKALNLHKIRLTYGYFSLPTAKLATVLCARNR